MGVVHVLAVRHATCPTHGEVIHADPDGLDSAPVHTLAGQAVGGVPVAAAEEADEHCLYVATRRRELAGLLPAQATLAAPTTAVVPFAVLASVPFGPFALLRLAPKTSPPAAV